MMDRFLYTFQIMASPNSVGAVYPDSEDGIHKFRRTLINISYIKRAFEVWDALDETKIYTCLELESGEQIVISEDFKEFAADFIMMQHEEDEDEDIPFTNTPN